MKTARLKWVENLRFLADTPSGHTIALDGPPEAGGDDRTVRPGELTLLALGGCTGIDVILILRKMRVEYDSLEIVVDAEPAEKPPKVWTKINVKFILEGKDIDKSKVEKAVTLSKEKYCSVSAMLGKTAEMSHEVIITES